MAAFWGEKERGSYAVEVANITERADHTAIRVLRGSPGPGCATIEVLTYPADVVVAERITKAAGFVFEDMALDC